MKGNQLAIIYDDEIDSAVYTDSPIRQTIS